jgi:subtilase family serine protease
MQSGLTVSADAAQLQVLNGHVPRAAKTRQPVGSLDASAHLDLAMGLPLRNPEQLTNRLQTIYQPGSTNFRHYLTPDQFTAAHGPTDKDYQAVIAFATAHGLKVTGTHPNRTLLDVNGAVADIEKAFHVKMRLYQHPTQARQFFAPDAEPSVELDTPLLAISGLDNFIVPHPLLRRTPKSSTRSAHPMAGSGSGGNYQGADFRAAYVPGVSLTGAGQSVGLFELDGYVASDITSYNSEASLPTVTLTPVFIDGFNGSASLADGDDEVALDIDMAHSMAPGASIFVYEGPPPPSVANTDTSPVTTTHVNDVLNRMATDNKSLQLSCSWGFDINATTEQIFEQYGAQGQSFFLACGDSGAFVGAVPEPADNPYITIVGGTELTTTGPGGSWVSESTWNSGSSQLGTGATGGGVSITFPIPVWQQGISMTANQGSTTMRNTPDVAMVADNVWLIANGEGSPVGGTSVASPLWAGVIALVNEQAAATGQPPVGFANPALYAIGQSAGYSSNYHDITTGNNTTSASPDKFFAVAGYDLCTGWGTPAGANLIRSLLAPPAESLVITSPFGFTAIGPSGGPFNVTSQTYVLTNTGSAPLNWTLVNTSSWLTVSSIAGTLNPGDSAATVTVSLNSAASNVLISSFSGNLVISNLTDGSAQNREFDLLVGNGGFETGDFTDWTLSGSTNDNFVLAADDATIDGIAAITRAADSQFVHSGLYGAFLGQSGSVAYISQTVPTIAGQLYQLSYWLTSVADKGSTTPSGLVVNWNGATILTQTNLGAFAWTNSQFIVSATGPSATLQFGVRDDPSALGIDDVSVQPISSSFQSVTQSADTINFVWSALPGLVYQVQYSDTVSPPNWINLNSAITATSDTITASDSLTSASQRFYRVVLSLQ